MAEDKTRHQEKWVQAVVNGPQCLKRRSLVGVFLSMTEGLSWWTWINKGECLGWWFLARFGSNGVFLVIEWLVCVTQTARGTSAGECLSSSHYVFSPLLFSSCLPSFLNTWQKVTGRIGQLEAVRLNLDDSMVCVEDQRKKIVLEKQKIGERQLHDMEEKTSKLEDRVTAALVICEEHMSNYHTLLELMSSKAWAKNSRKEIAKWLGRRGCTLAMFRSGNGFTERRWRVILQKRRWWNVGLMEKHGWRNEHEKKPNGNYGRDKTEVWEVELFNLPMVLFKVVQEPVVVPHIQYIAVCGGKTSSPNLECSETVEDLPNAIQRTIGWSILLSWCIGFFPPRKKIDWVPQKTLWRARLHVQWDLCCVNCYLGANPDQCRLIFTTFFSPLLSFLVTSFLKRVSLGHFSNAYFSQCRKLLWKMGKQHLLFVVKNSIVETSLLWILIFVDFSKTKQISIRHFLPNVVKKILVLKYSPSQFFPPKKIWQKHSFFFSGGSSFSHFLFSSI